MEQQACPLHGRIIDEVYAKASSVVSPEMAASMGEQFCIPSIKDDFKSERLSVNASGTIIKHW